MLQVLAKRRPRHVIPDVALPTHGVSLHRLAERPHAPAFAHDLECHALPYVALRAAILNQRYRRPAQHVDEARGDDQPRGIDRLFRRAEIAPDGDDTVTANRDVSGNRRAATTVDNLATRDEEIELRGRGGLFAGTGSDDQQQPYESVSFDHG